MVPIPIASPKLVAAPVMGTERLILRRHGLADFDDYFTMWSDPAVARAIGGGKASRETTWLRFLRYAGHWSLMGFGYWAIEWRETGRFIGEVGFADFRRDIDPSLDGMPEIGWALAREAQGLGLATEAVRAVVAWGDTHFDPAIHTACLINPDNTASLRIAETFGYRESARTIYKDRPIFLLVRGAVPPTE